MRKIIVLWCIIAMIALSAGFVPAEEEEPTWSQGTIAAYLAGESITITSPGENDGEEVRVTFVFSEDTEIFGELSVGAQVEIEHLGDRALYIQLTEEE